MPLDQVDVDKLDKNSEMSFLDHLEALRWHLVRSVAAIAVAAIVVFIFKNYTFHYLILWPTKESFPTYRLFCDILNIVCISPDKLQIITRKLGEQFFIHLKSSVWLGLIIVFPYVIWEAWRFIKPGLYPKEKKAGRGVVLACSFLFYLGIVFGYFVVTPFAVSFLSSYSVDPTVAHTVTLGSYVSYLVMFCIPTGIVFEMPVVIYFLAKIGLVDSTFLIYYRRHAVVVIFIVAAVVTPPDFITMILIAIPLLLLYEVSIFLVKRVEKQRKKLEAE